MLFIRQVIIEVLNFLRLWKVCDWNPTYLHYSCSLKHNINDKKEFTYVEDDLTVNMETIEDGIRSMDIVNTAAVVTTMAKLYLVYHQLGVFLSGLNRIYLIITKNIVNDLF